MAAPYKEILDNLDRLLSARKRESDGKLGVRATEKNLPPRRLLERIRDILSREEKCIYHIGEFTFPVVGHKNEAVDKKWSQLGGQVIWQNHASLIHIWETVIMDMTASHEAHVQLLILERMGFCIKTCLLRLQRLEYQGGMEEGSLRFPFFRVIKRDMEYWCSDSRPPEVKYAACLWLAELDILQ